MTPRLRISILAFAAGGFALLTNAAANASENQAYHCGGNGISISIELEPETGTAKISSPRGLEQLSARADGVWRDVSEELQFMPDEAPPMLWMGPEQFSCEPVRIGSERSHDSGAAGGNETMLNIAGRSLGGRLRNGPGTNFSPTGSLAEGDPVTIVANTGVGFDGYDWFEIRTTDGVTAYQWGGIMCSVGEMIGGIYEQCRR
jgi:hypothetical protein